MGLLKKAAQMTIKGFKDAERKQKASVPEIKLPYRAESLALKMGNQFSPSNALNTISGDNQFQKGKEAKLDITFILDDTRFTSLPEYALGKRVLFGGGGVKDTIEELMKVTYSMEGSTHEPGYLILSWGESPLGDGKGGGFYCRLDCMDVSYKVFNDDGKPLIAEVKCCFIESLSDKAITNKEKKSSPDLTHIRQIHEKETLPLKTWEIYQDPMYLVEVARVNSLNSLRRLRVGDSLVFPPVDEG